MTDRGLQDERLRLQRLIAHRELQLVRAEKTRSRKYIAERQKLLRSAQRALERVERRAP